MNGSVFSSFSLVDYLVYVILDTITLPRPPFFDCYCAFSHYHVFYLLFLLPIY